MSAKTVVNQKYSDMRKSCIYGQLSDEKYLASDGTRGISDIIISLIAYATFSAFEAGGSI